jgi:CheY-like chemotaxis protein
MPNLLYVDHDLTRLGEIQHQLSEHFQLEVAFNGWEGFANSVMNKPDVVLLNLELPVMDGLELVRLVRTEPDCAHLILLGFSLKELSSEFAETAERLGLNQLVGYPFAQQLPAELFKMLPVATQD